MNKDAAVKQKAKWLAYCLEIGFIEKSQLDKLSAIWDQFKDEFGNLRPAIPILPAQRIVNETHEWGKGYIEGLKDCMAKKEANSQPVDDAAKEYADGEWKSEHSDNVLTFKVSALIELCRQDFLAGASFRQQTPPVQEQEEKDRRIKELEKQVQDLKNEIHNMKHPF